MTKPRLGWTTDEIRQLRGLLAHMHTVIGAMGARKDVRADLRTSLRRLEAVLQLGGSTFKPSTED